MKKKLVALVTMGTVLAGTAFSTVSAEEYKVETGDSLWKIANDHEVSVKELVEINDLEDTIIHPNQIIDIDTDSEYVVESGDTLSGIGKEFGVKVKDIKQWNDLDSDLITIGQKLEIKGANINTDKQAPAKEEAPAKAEEVKEEKPVKQEKQQKEEPKEKQEEQVEVKSESSAKDKAPEGDTISVSSTAYTADCNGCSGITSTGVDLNANPNAKVIAVDPSVIPLGSKVHVEGYGTAIAADVGGAINGNKIDVHVPSKGEAMNWGVKTVNVTILD